tara:strand:- start:705 stop:1757 length:1053 start_codon:yes stop_codon:yes gene_type:complete
MSKPNITPVTVTQTFQSWLDKTNDIVSLLQTDVMTASALGDSTTGDATLVGNFTASNIIANTSLQTNTISPKAGFSTISATAPIEISSSGVVTQTLISPVGPRMHYSSGSVIWATGFDNAANNDFIIDTGTGTQKLRLTPTGDLYIAGKFYAANGIEIPVGESITGNLIGNVTGQVSDISNHDTDGLSEGTSNLFFTTARARASLVAGTGVTYASSTGTISIGQAVSTVSNVTFNKVTANGGVDINGELIATGDVTAFGSISDITMKENIVPIHSALEKVLQLGGYTFNYKGNDTPMTGVIAQEIMKVLPGIVYEHENPKTKETIYAVRHGNLVGLLIEAIKELNEKVGR